MATADVPLTDQSALGSDFDPTVIESTVILDPVLSQQLRQQRADSGADRWDEVWEGNYMMAPIANNDHQDIATTLAAVLRIGIGFDSKTRVLAGVNISDRETDWSQNYRIPHVAVIHPESSAVDRGTFFQGGPDFAIEIVSPHDRTRDKLDFYAKVETGELLIVDREPWQLELFRLDAGKLTSVGTSTVDSGETLTAERIPFSFKLVAGEPRPRLFVSTVAREGQWLV